MFTLSYLFNRRLKHLAVFVAFTQVVNLLDQTSFSTGTKFFSKAIVSVLLFSLHDPVVVYDIVVILSNVNRPC
jgi:hypothetical protein